MLRRNLWLVLCVAMIPACRTRLNDERTVNLDPAKTVTLRIEPVNREQKVKVEAKSAEIPFDLYIYLKEDELEAEKNINLRKKDKILEQKTKTQEAALEVTIPAQKAGIVRLYSGKKTAVTVKMTN